VTHFLKPDCPVMMDSGPLTTFHLFPKLPMELRLLIWEFTWPPPWIIEAINYEDRNAEEFRELAILRIWGSLLKCLSRTSLTRKDEPLEDYQHPIALWVCNESRQHTLRRYTALQHAEFKAGSFYFSPDYDILWFSPGFTPGYGNIDEIEDYYGDQIHHIKNVMVDELERVFMTPADDNVFYRLGNIENLFILCETHEDYSQLVLPDTKDLLSLFEYNRNEYGCFMDKEDPNSGGAKHVNYITRRAQSGKLLVSIEV
jgi:hypothetical protein